MTHPDGPFGPGLPKAQTATEQARRAHERRSFVNVDDLQRAAERCDGYLVRYGLEVTWSLHVLGLKMVACYGADKLERFVSWREFRDARFDILEQTEQYALAGLSS